MNKLYPMLFEPILKKTIWGGDQLTKFKNITPKQDGIGESWELSVVPNSVSVVANGANKGKKITELIAEAPKQLLGETVVQRFGTEFPLLIKFIDAKQDLSIQVHPSDDLARKRHNCNGKTEMWYVIDCKPSATLYAGLKENLTPETYVERIENNSITDALKLYELEKGSVFFLPAGAIHAIRQDTLVAEIQQSSDITYRIYDYNRVDKEGNLREIHTELAKDAINYSIENECKVDYTPKLNEQVPLVQSTYFTTEIIQLDGKMELSFEELNSFVVLINMQGKCRVSYDNQHLDFQAGQTILIPATMKGVSLETSEEVKILKTYID